MNDSDTPPRHPLFDQALYSGARAPGSIATDSERQRLDFVKRAIADHQKKEAAIAGSSVVPRARARHFLPYLLVRSFAGDRGDRPLPLPQFVPPDADPISSPDIWCCAGDPATMSALPVNQGSELVVAGSPYTLYAHVWNLGRAPVVGVSVEFSVSTSPAARERIGGARVDLPPRSSLECHRLVKCPVAWIPQPVSTTRLSIWVRVSSIGDTIGASHPWEPAYDRHVGQRRFTVVKNISAV